MTNLNGTIKIFNDVQHEIDPRIYSHFLEELGDQIHNGVWAYSDVLKKLSMMEDPQINLIRKDLFEAMYDIMKPIGDRKNLLRWPGGNFCESYFWKRGIGPREERQLNGNEFWGPSKLRKGFIYNFGKKYLRKRLKMMYGDVAPDHDNQFGTDEFLTLCEKLGVEPYINVNFGCGTPEDAADWIEYCNGSIDTKWGAERAKNGHPEPYNVKYWGIGNEIWGGWIIGFCSRAKTYTDRFKLFGKAMKERDSSIKLIACGIDNIVKGPLFAKDTPIWNKVVLSELKEYVDFISGHLYIGNSFNIPFLRWPPDKSAETEEGYYALMSSPLMYEEMIERCESDIEETLGKDSHVKMLIDEWNIWMSASQLIKANHPLTDGIWTASTLHVFQNNSTICPINNYSMLVNTFGLIRTDDEGIVKTPSYHAMNLIWNHTQPNLLKSEVQSDTFDNGPFINMVAREGTPFLDCNATISKNGKNITLTVVNKHLIEKIECTIDFDGFNGQDLKAIKIIQMGSDGNPMKEYNTPEKRENIIPVEIGNNSYQNNKIVLPPHSFTVLKFEC
ncbi:MAG: hypothetical protein GY870_03595 [archaeon]|nr:hypothetical protein [archaeon]